MHLRKSFTLIEILVVIVVVGVLSAFILVGMSSITSSANIAKGKAFINSMDNSLLLSRVSEWKLDNSTGADSWSGKTATLVNSPTLTSNCAQDSCYTFNGSLSQYAWIDDDDGPLFNFGSYMSAFVWVKGGAQENMGIFGQYNSTGDQRSWIIRTTQNRVYITISDNGTANTGHLDSSNSVVALDDKWHQVGFTFNSGTISIYADGVSQSNTVVETTLYNSNANVVIGAWSNPISYFTGQIDDARLYNQPIPTSLI
jgi:prepilin-type N-terminal cleavage/methylation domain-containing protein